MADTAVLSSQSPISEKVPPDQRGDGPKTSNPSPAWSIAKETDAADFKPSLRVWLAFLILCVLTLMAALDGTSISVALPV
jgi:hypothetical protein